VEMTFALPVNTYREDLADSTRNMVNCGEAAGYQVQGMDSLELDSTYTLFNRDPDLAISPDRELATLAREMNQYYAPKARAALKAKREQLVAAGHAEVAARTEITVMLTDHGLQLGFDYALPRKELAPAPRKPLLRRILGPLYPGRKYWVMPETAEDGPGRTYTVWWPWLFWAAVLIAGAVATYIFGVSDPPAAPAEPVEA
jgi:hypothetical protein